MIRKCGAGCSVVLTFGRCAAYAADQDAGSTAAGWAESYGSADGARRAALAECGSRGGSGCIVRVWGCNGSVVEEELGLDRAARREIQEGLQAANLGIEKLRFLCRLAKDLGHLDERRYEYAARSLDETGRLIGGWRKAHEAAQG